MNIFLSALLFFPLVGFLSLFFFDRNVQLIKFIALFFSIETFLLSLFIWFLFDNSTGYFQFCEVLVWQYHEVLIGIDGISLFFIILTTFLVPLCILSQWDNELFFKEYAMGFLIIEFFLIFLFCILDLFLFFIFFESVLIPLFILIGLLGSGRRKVRSGYLFFFYTLLGSTLMFVSILFMQNYIGTFNYQILSGIKLSAEIQNLLWLGFIIAFLSKIPVVPFHIWLPEAHVEAPTGGSVLLAGILLKLGTYGILRFLLPLFPLASIYFLPVIFMISGISIIYTSSTAIRQTDLKRIIAYTSVAHMNLVVFALFSFNIVSLEGSIFQMLSHGIVSSALFFCIGFFYNRYHTRVIDNFGGAVQILPQLTSLFFIFILANMAFPCTSNFAGEFLMLTGIFLENSFVAILGALGMVLSGAYSLWIFNRMCFGNIKLSVSLDLNKFEKFILLNLCFFTIFLGIYPTLLTSSFNLTLMNFLEQFLYKI